MTEEQNLKIGELAKSLGVTPRTLRYYEEIGLMPPALRLEGGARVYAPDEVLRLRFILKLKELGITLEEMTELSGIYEQKKTPKGILPRLVEMLDDHLLKIDEKITRISALRTEIANYRTRIVEEMREKKK